MLPPQARVLLKSVFGYDDFRPGQAEIIAAVLAGGPVLAVMPTGSGKSMCYQLPAIVEGALTVVVSPLIALMRDQVRQMRALGVAAATLNSMNDAAENDEARRAMRDGANCGCSIVSPERLVMDGLIADAAPRRRRAASPSTRRIASREWGHDFRPEYRELGRAARSARRRAGDRPHRDRRRGDARRHRQQLFPRRRSSSCTVSTGPTSRLISRRRTSRDASSRAFSTSISGESGIVYCSSRKRTEELAALLSPSRVTTRSPITPAWSRRRAIATRTASCRRTASSSSRPSPSAWASTSRTCASSPCRHAVERREPTTRRSAAPAATGCRPTR